MLISSMALMFSFVLPDISNGVREVSDFNECRCRTSQQLELKFTVSGVHCRQDNQRDFLSPHTENKKRLKEEDGNYGDKSFIRFHASPYRAKSEKKRMSKCRQGNILNDAREITHQSVILTISAILTVIQRSHSIFSKPRSLNSKNANTFYSPYLC